MNSLFQAGLELQRFMEKENWRFCFIGGLALIRWGGVRMTQDIDLSLLTGFGNEERFIKGLLKNFQSRIQDASDFAFANRVLLLSASNGVPVDISLSGLSFEELMIKQATLFKYAPECLLRTCSAENLVVLKAFADRPIDWMDIEGIVMRQGKSLDCKYIVKQLAPLCKIKESPEIIEKLNRVIEGL